MPKITSARPWHRRNRSWSSWTRSSRALDLADVLIAELQAGRVRDRIDLVRTADGKVGIDITAEYELADVETAIADLAGGATRGRSIVRIG
ncbi:hypothetical protein AB0B45_24095 [Nonomuraea sp. NPDC049152]|uniref:hypothetical protein n=1 Tax=Nonomuraea sp. NPDC049152 TaxID=3154350 RepID=UPI0033F45BD0